MDKERIDIPAITELKEMLEEEFDELIQTYIRDTDTKLAQLENAIEPVDCDEVRKLAHSMKGASVNIGILQYGEICHRLEVDALNQTTEHFSDLLLALQNEYTAVKIELAQI